MVGVGLGESECCGGVGLWDDDNVRSTAQFYAVSVLVSCVTTLLYCHIASFRVVVVLTLIIHPTRQIRAQIPVPSPFEFVTLPFSFLHTEPGRE